MVGDAVTLGKKFEVPVPCQRAKISVVLLDKIGSSKSVHCAIWFPPTPVPTTLKSKPLYSKLAVTP